MSRRLCFALIVALILAASEVEMYFLVPPHMRWWYPAMITFTQSLFTSYAWCVWGPPRRREVKR